MLAEMISQIAALFESACTARVFALEEEFNTLGVWVFDLNGFMPIIRNAFKVLRLKVLMWFNPVFMIHQVIVIVWISWFILINYVFLLSLCFARKASLVCWLISLFNQKFSFLLRKIESYILCFRLCLKTPFFLILSGLCLLDTTLSEVLV